MAYPETNLHIIKTGYYNSQFVYKQMSQSPDRIVEYYEIEFFLENGGISFINNQSYPIIKTNMLIAKPGQKRHSILHFKAFYVHFNTDNPTLQHILNNLPHVCQTGENSLKMERLLKQIIQHFHYSDPVHMIYAESKLLELIFHLATQTRTVKTQEAYPSYVLLAIEYIERNYKENIQLEDISHAIGLTPVYLHKLFHASIGQTPHQYLLTKRLAMAKELLSCSDMSLANVAAESGFSSQAYFNAVFKKFYNTTPLTFRKDTFRNYLL